MRRRCTNGTRPLGKPSGPIDTEQREPTHEVGGQDRRHQPGGVAVEAGEREPAESRFLQSSVVLFNVEIGTHTEIQICRVTVPVSGEGRPTSGSGRYVLSIPRPTSPVPLAGIEPALSPPEGDALSAELQGRLWTGPEQCGRLCRSPKWQL
jgi:hypothetical protein